MNKPTYTQYVHSHTPFTHPFVWLLLLFAFCQSMRIIQLLHAIPIFVIIALEHVDEWLLYAPTIHILYNILHSTVYTLPTPEYISTFEDVSQTSCLWKCFVYALPTANISYINVVHLERLCIWTNDMKRKTHNWFLLTTDSWTHKRTICGNNESRYFYFSSPTNGVFVQENMKTKSSSKCHHKNRNRLMSNIDACSNFTPLAHK